MNMWALLMIVLFVLAFVGILYLASRIQKFTFFKRITKEKRIMQIIVSILIVVAITAVLWLAWGSMNAIICILHLLVFWLISDGIFALIKKLGKKTFVRYYAGIAAIVFTVGYLGIGWYQAHHVWETTYDIQSGWKAESSSTFRFTYRNNISWRRFCKAYEGHSEAKSGYCIDCWRFCGR